MTRIKTEADLRFIDVNLRKIIIEIYARGGQTMFSCAGHRQKDSTYERGYITAIRNPEITRQVLLDNNITIDEEKAHTHTVFRFKGLGGRTINPHEVLDFDPNIEITPDLVTSVFNRNLSRVGIPHNSNLRKRIFYALYKSFEGKEIRKNKNIDYAADNMTTNPIKEL